MSYAPAPEELRWQFLHGSVAALRDLHSRLSTDIAGFAQSYKIQRQKKFLFYFTKKKYEQYAGFLQKIGKNNEKNIYDREDNPESPPNRIYFYCRCLKTSITSNTASKYPLLISPVAYCVSLSEILFAFPILHASSTSYDGWFLT